MDAIAGWADFLRAFVPGIVPVALSAAVGFYLGSRRDRNAALTTARLRHYDELATNLNTVMCYLTFIGRWKELSPPEVIAVKRILDEQMSVAAPLFSRATGDAYTRFSTLCFASFRGWGKDAGLLTSAYRRRATYGPGKDWDPEWDACFMYADEDPVSADEITAIRVAYDDVLRSMVRDISRQRTRRTPTTLRISQNIGRTPGDAGGESTPT